MEIKALEGAYEIQHEDFPGYCSLKVNDLRIWNDPRRWVLLEPLNCSDYVLFEDGEVVQLDASRNLKRSLAKYLRGKYARWGVTLVADGTGQQKYFLVHLLVAWAFVPREGSVSHRVYFKDDNPLNTHADNLMWEKLPTAPYPTT